MRTSSSRPVAESAARKAAVLGYPIEHSRSPDLHRAAYAALGLAGWTYERIPCRAGELSAIVDGLGPEYVGLSVTMPGKPEALAYAHTVTDRARLVGSANTLVAQDSGWLADCTDIDGVTGALAEVGVEFDSGGAAVVLGAGGTARPALAALAAAGADEVAIVVRDRRRAADAMALSTDLDLPARVIDFDDVADVRSAFDSAQAVVSTVPATAAASLVAAVGAPLRLVDAIYDPWPTPLATRVRDAGGTVAGGLVMLLNQAYRQVELFTGREAPRTAMAQALR